MTLGAIWAPAEDVRKIHIDIRDIKRRHNLNKKYEAKWTKISKSKIDFYRELISYFFKNDRLHFRGYIINDKDKLRHEEFQQDHNDWYFKMYFGLLTFLLSPENRYRIYLDIKDTCSSIKIKKLHDVICSKFYDFKHEIVENIQTVHSKEIGLIQLTDIFIGALSYMNRNLTTSSSKNELITFIKEKSGYSLKYNTLIKESKFNIFYWKAQNKETA